MFPAQHLDRIGVERLDTVALCEGLKPLPIPVRTDDQVHLRSVPQRLGVGAGEPLRTGVIMVVELPVDVQRRRGTIHVIYVESVADTLRQVVEQAHPSQSDNSCTIPFHVVLLR